jgi:hypothetical protein
MPRIDDKAPEFNALTSHKKTNHSTLGINAANIVTLVTKHNRI